MTKGKGWWMGCAVFLFVFLLTTFAAHAQTFTTLFKFSGADGANPNFTSLVQGADGALYGLTVGGGTGACANLFGCGTIFKLMPGHFSKIFDFSCAQPNCNQLAFPIGTLALDNDGILYGAANGGGSFFCGASNGCGGLFKITPSGKFTSLYTFTSSSQGYGPWGLTLANDGNFYGTASAGGSSECAPTGCGTAFRLTPTGTFSLVADLSGADAVPAGQLTLGSDGELYGAASGFRTTGSVFRMSLSGKITYVPLAWLAAGSPVQGVDGNFYELAEHQGGIVFTGTPQGDLSILYQFCQSDCSGQGAEPNGVLLQATDGNFYGMTRWGGDLTCNPPNGCGMLFQISPTGAFALLHTFEGTDGEQPINGLVQKTDGVLYGLTYEGGNFGNKECEDGCGTIFSLDMGLSPFVSFVVPVGRVGQIGGILGQGFTGTTAVTINGVLANFNVITDTYLTATIPPGATTGYVSVTTPSGVLTSNVPFQVIP